MEEKLYKRLIKIMYCFSDSRIVNNETELVLETKTNTYFIIQGLKTEKELIAKMFHWVSRDVVKSMPYKLISMNNKFRFEMLKSFNKALETNFSMNDMEVIYNRLGNGINPQLTSMFIDSNYDMDILKKGK